MAVKVDYAQICKHVLYSDPLIRFAGAATIDGDIMAAQIREGTDSLLTPEEAQLSIMQALLKGGIRRTMEGKLGKTVYASAVYQKVKRATVTMYSDGGAKADAVLLVSFEKEADHEAIITKKILPFLNSAGMGLAN